MLWARTFPTKPYDLSQLGGSLVSLGQNNTAFLTFTNLASLPIPVSNGGEELYELIVTPFAGLNFFSGENSVSFGSSKCFVDTSLNLVNGSQLALTVGQSLGTLVFPQLTSGQFWIGRLS